MVMVNLISLVDQCYFLLTIIFIFLFTYQVPGNVWGEAIAVVAVCLGSQTVNFVRTY